jgi:hypothetical protein
MHKTTLSLILISFFFSCSAQSNEEETVNQSATEDSVKLELDSVDIDFQFRGRCYAFNSAKHNVESNGEAHSSNLAQKTDDSFTKNDNYLFLNTQEYEGSDNNRAAHKLYLVNTTKSKISYSAQDSRLNIVAQALDENGEWKDISYLPSSWCGNSYHKVTLGKNEYWRFYVPVFKGTFATKLRYVLLDGGENLLVSNEIDVLINPGQFNAEKKQGHNSEGIMDPYDD